MPQVVMVSSVSNADKLRTTVERYFEQGRYSEITESIGLHSILIDPDHMIGDQNRHYRFVLDLIKNRITKARGKAHASWYLRFPEIMSELAESEQVVTDAMSAAMVSDRHQAGGPFRSVEDFYFWALDDRRLSLDHIVKYIETAAELCKG